jgi:hypothetical protein
VLELPAAELTELVRGCSAVPCLCRCAIGLPHPPINWVVSRPDNLIDADTLGPHAFHPSPTSSAIFEAGCTSRLPVAHVMAELITDVSLWATWAGRMPWC